MRLDNYRITIDDAFEAMEFGGIRSLQPGDAVRFRTGWNQLLQSRDPGELARWGARTGLPGIWLREARFLASFRPSLVGSDTWALERLGRPEITGTSAFAAHQELIMRNGIRITPQFAEGATCGSTPPAALAQPS